jgi:hypothetical protein
MSFDIAASAVLHNAHDLYNETFVRCYDLCTDKTTLVLFRAGFIFVNSSVTIAPLSR